MSYSATQRWWVHGKEWKESQRDLSFYNTIPETKFRENWVIRNYMMYESETEDVCKTGGL
jgi:hypothetical protein